MSCSTEISWHIHRQRHHRELSSNALRKQLVASLTSVIVRRVIPPFSSEPDHQPRLKNRRLPLFSSRLLYQQTVHGDCCPPYPYLPSVFFFFFTRISHTLLDGYLISLIFRNYINSFHFWHSSPGNVNLIVTISTFLSL